MHMVTETYQLRDGEKLTEFYNGIDWESLFEFVRHYYSIGVEQMPTTCLKPNGRIEVNWPENLRDMCGLFGHTYREVYLQTFSSCCFHDITYDKDIVDKYLARPDFYRLNISLENDCNGTSSDAYLQLTFSLKHIGFSGGYTSQACSVLNTVKIQAGSLYPEKAKSSWERRNKKSPLIFGWAAFFTC